MASDDAIHETILIYAVMIPNKYCDVAVAAFVLYDLLITLPREIRLFWTSQVRILSALLYFSNKYMILLATAVPIVKYIPMSDSLCTGMVMTGNVFAYLSLVPPAVFGGLRTYALTNHRLLSGVVFLLLSVQIVTDVLQFRFHAFVRATYLPRVGCVEFSATPPTLVRIFTLTNRISTIVADILLVAITWKFLPGGTTGNGRIESIKTKGIMGIMLRNGLLYFVVLSTMSILQLILVELSLLLPDSQTTLVQSFAAPLSNILISHFLLDLQEAHQRKAVFLDTEDPLDISQSLSIHSLNFARALGSIGATIETPEYPQEDDDEGTDDGLRD